jgi:sec-independent protein translocase protein TatB
MGLMRRQANEFRAQFDEAMRETELEQIKKDVENLGRDAEATMRDAEHAIHTDIKAVNADVEKAISASGDAARIEPPVPHDALNGVLSEAAPSTHADQAHATVHADAAPRAHEIATTHVDGPAKVLAETAPAKTGS